MKEIAIILLIVGILHFILLFKIWKMTDDINILKHRFCNPQYSYSLPVFVTNKEDFATGETVIIKQDGKKGIIKNYHNNIYSVEIEGNIGALA